MTIPTHEEAMLPVLRSLETGEARHRRWLSDAVADQFKLSDNERAVLLPSGKAPVFRSRTGWALTYLTDRGRSVLQDNPEQLDNDPGRASLLRAVTGLGDSLAAPPLLCGLDLDPNYEKLLIFTTHYEAGSPEISNLLFTCGTPPDSIS